MMRAAFHGADGVGTRGVGDYVGSPMYAIIPEHVPAVIGVVALIGGAWLVRRRAGHGRDRAG